MRGAREFSRIREVASTALGESPVEDLIPNELLDLDRPTMTRVGTHELREESTVSLGRGTGAPGRAHGSIETGTRTLCGVGVPRRYAASAAEIRSKPLGRAKGE